jgi:hypothetical protein
VSAGDDKDAGWQPRPSSADAKRNVYDAFSESEEWDAQRVQAEQNMLHFHTDGIGASDPGAAAMLMEAMRYWTVDLLDMGHYPSRQMLAFISCQLKALYWPDRKQAKRTEEAAWLLSVQQRIDHLAATKYCNTSNPRTRAEEEVAKLLKLSVHGLRKNRERYGARLEKREAAVERQREAAVQRRRQRQLRK